MPGNIKLTPIADGKTIEFEIDAIAGIAPSPKGSGTEVVYGTGSTQKTIPVKEDFDAVRLTLAPLTKNV